MRTLIAHVETRYQPARRHPQPKITPPKRPPHPPGRRTLTQLPALSLRRSLLARGIGGRPVAQSYTVWKADRPVCGECPRGARHGFTLSYSWTKAALQRSGLVSRASRRGAHRRRRPRNPCVGMMLHQDGSRHEWLVGQPPLGLNRHSGRRDLGDLFGLPGGGGRHRLDLPGDEAGVRPPGACRHTLHSTPVAAATTSTCPRPTARWTGASRSRSGAPCTSSASSTSPPTRPKRGGALSASSEPSTIAWSRNWRWQVELVFKRLKSLAQLGHLPKHNDESACAWLYGKLPRGAAG